MSHALQHSFDVSPGVMACGVTLVLLFLALIPFRPAIAAAFALIGVQLVALLMYAVHSYAEHIVVVVTTGTAVLGAAVMFLKYRSARVEGFAPVILFLLFTAVVALGVLRAPSSVAQLSSLKFELFLALGVVPFFVGRQCSRSDELLRSVLNWVLVMGSIYVVFCLALYVQGRVGDFGEGRFANFGAPIQIARNCGITIVLCVAYFFEPAWVRRGLLLVVAIAAFIILLATASRGPFLATVVGGMAAGLTYRRISGKIAVAILGSITILVLFALLAPDQALRRLHESYGQSLSSISNGRLGIYGLALNHATDSPLMGLGTAGFCILDGNYKNISYPHNMFLEVLIEYGVVGLAVFIPLLVLTAIGAARFVCARREDPVLGRGYLAMMLVAFLVAQTSEHLGLLSFFWFLCGVFSNRAAAQPSSGIDPYSAEQYHGAYGEELDPALSYTPIISR